AGGLPGTYVAWLSSSTVDAKDRLGTARGWVRRDLRPVVDTVADLIAGRIRYPIRVDELGNDHSLGTVAVFTGTQPDGTGLSDGTCLDFTATNGSAIVGELTGGAVKWTQLGAPSVFCGAHTALYCFGIDRATALPEEPAPQRRAFVSANTFASGNGIGPADTLCTDEAVNAGLAGTFRALLGTTTASPASRFMIGAPWSRMDGVVITTAFELSQAALDET